MIDSFPKPPVSRAGAATPALPDFENTAIAFAGKSNSELGWAHWLFSAMNNAALTRFGTGAVSWAIGIGLPVSGVIKATLFKQFCGGETLEECERTASRLASSGVKTILDYSVEGEKTEAGFDAAVEKILATVGRAQANAQIPFAVFKTTGVVRFELLEKVSAGAALSAAESAEFDRAKSRVKKLCGAAHDAGVPVMMDAEESWIQPAIDDLVYEMMRAFNRERCAVYNTFQMYRHDRLSALRTAVEAAEQGGYFFGVKLVRGAYMEKERKRAAELSYPSPIHPSKAETDAAYDAALEFCAAHIGNLSLCAGTHNEASSLLLTKLISEKNLIAAQPELYFSQLYGMGDHLSYNLASAGFNVAKYVPYGPVKSVLPYLIRRAEENSSIAGHVSRELRLIEAEKRRRAR